MLSDSAVVKAVAYTEVSHRVSDFKFIFSNVAEQTYTVIRPGTVQDGDVYFYPGGGTYEGSQEVTLTCPEGWRICYTTDGSAPVDRMLISDPFIGVCSSSNSVTFTVSESATVRAVPFQINGVDYIFGQEGSQEYIIAVVFSPGGGTYEGAQEVTLSCASGWQICYTTDGSDPVSNGFPSGKGYANPVVVPVSKSCTVRAVSYKENPYGYNLYTISDIFEQTYTIIPPLPELLSGVNTVTLEAVNEPVSYRFTPAEDGYYLFVFPGYNNVVEVYDGETRIAPAAGATPSVRCFADLESGKNYTVRFTAMQTAGDVTATVQRLYTVALDPETEHGGFAMDTYAGGYAAEDGNIIGLQVAGGTVSLIPEPEEGYTLTEITVVDASGETVADATGGWTMPEGGVTVYARFDRAYTLSFEGDDNVYFNMSRIGGLGGGAFRPVPVLPGQTVQLSWQCEDPDYIPDTFSVTTASGAAVPFAFRWLEEMNRQVMEFEMPEEDVTASVTSCLFSFDRADFVLPADTRVIEDNAYDGDRNISVAVIPSGCERIGKEAFKDCKNLERIRIPADCTVGEDAFAGCGRVYVFSTADSDAYNYCADHDNCVFVEE